uniref:Uncharacterized protein n=1 Tax=Hordeum vulgare subsp. vulgare TaxID=112509 RepID=A0A8I6YJA8_HORVV
MFIYAFQRGLPYLTYVRARTQPCMHTCVHQVEGMCSNTLIYSATSRLLLDAPLTFVHTVQVCPTPVPLTFCRQVAGLVMAARADFEAAILRASCCAAGWVNAVRIET